MKTKDVKIQFVTIFKSIYLSSIEKENPGIEDIEKPFYEIDDVIKFILKLTKKKRFYTLKSDKFCFLEEAVVENNFISGYFKSARNEFRPNIINKQTGEERINPKSRLDGEIEKTHFVIKIDKDSEEVFIFLESNFNGITILNLVNYFNKFSKVYATKSNLSTSYSLKHTIVGINNFKTELERLHRTKVAEIYYDKEIIGNDFFNLTDRLLPVKEDVILTVKADKGMDIRSIGLRAFDSIGIKSNISRVRIKGQDDNGNETTIDTGIMARKEYVNSMINEDTGEFNTVELLKQINVIAKSF
ncbi:MULTISPECIES: hypothetical protein [Elizabethkingia]|nr:MULTISPECIES: hypothetical protein [Elizabethkingia]MDX8570176.1 hypothetical protein [Elizabethkingia sp. HX QKY]PSL88194.1 hypothetical protein C7V10_11450 [Elizabethkingia miricola]QHQ87661.1 hypothetical protein FE632_13070 [Elizabethkingia miricola]UIO95161.1 hypothetical protein LYZ41_13270 [Elizabethkingia miricola]WER11958.1 hypothetical protein P0M31_13050 [Elizabethkingia miricola]